MKGPLLLAEMREIVLGRTLSMVLLVMDAEDGSDGRLESLSFIFFFLFSLSLFPIFLISINKIGGIVITDAGRRLVKWIPLPEHLRPYFLFLFLFDFPFSFLLFSLLLFISTIQYPLRLRERSLWGHVEVFMGELIDVDLHLYLFHPLEGGFNGAVSIGYELHPRKKRSYPLAAPNQRKANSKRRTKKDAYRQNGFRMLIDVGVRTSAFLHFCFKIANFLLSQRVL